jgi:CoA:oxalate CoA-transferase
MIEGPYHGLKVVDCTRVLAGPYCAMFLADQGATVIKVEVPGQGDDSRHIGPFINGKSAYFMGLNRGKHSIALDLKAQADREVFERLLGEADVLIENYRGGTMEKLGYDWPSLHARCLYRRADRRRSAALIRSGRHWLREASSAWSSS